MATKHLLGKYLRYACDEMFAHFGHFAKYCFTQLKLNKAAYEIRN